MSEFTRCPNPKFQGEPQSIASMCWFAGYVMLFRWSGMEEKTIKSHVWNTLESAGIDVNGAKANGLSLSKNLTAAKALGLGARGFGQPVSEWNLREVVRQSPVWATGRWYETTNHVYVIVGVSETEVEYYDPWYDISPDDSFTMQKTTLNWVLNGDGKSCKGLAHTFQWYPLQFFK
jgi:hypothetical protein